MKLTFALGAVGVAGLLVLAGELTQPAAADKGDGAIGPDVTVSRLGLGSSGSSDDFHYYGQSGSIKAFSMASTSCNVGDEVAEWVDTSPDARNPVIAQNLYRLNDGKFEQIGMSWLKHSFCAVSENTCGSCQPTNCNTLGIGCADTYWATLNGSHSGIGPRWDINPLGMGPGGVHDDSYPQPVGPDTIRGRLQVQSTDIVGGAQYFAEVHYVTHDEDLERRWNNASFREVNVTSSSISGVGSGQGSVEFQRAAIMGWQDNDASVEIVPFEDGEQGRYHLGYTVTDNEDGTWTYEYALHNMNSRRGAGSFSVPVGSGASVLSSGFHDVDYHSGDGVGAVTRDGTDWPMAVGGASASWSVVEDYATNNNGNGLQWGTLYNFRLTSNAAPVDGMISVGMYKDGAGSDTLMVSAKVPGDVGTICVEDIAGDDGTVDTQDLLALLGGWGTDGAGADIAAPTNIVDISDLLGLLAAWGDCE